MTRKRSIGEKRFLSKVIPSDSQSFGGYSPKASIVISMFNIILSLVLIVLSSPVLIILALVIKLKDRGPILYKGIRLGQNKNPYIMYKFRTLPQNADKIIGPRILTPGIVNVNYLSKILRDTRLDELPQLFNILKGEMQFVGPRPVRPEIYETLCKQIPNYDIRFLIKPGMIGFSQLYTAHTASKRLRSMIDNRQIIRSRYIIKDFFIILFTIYRVVWLAAVKIGEYIWMNIIESRILKKYKESRLVDRIRHHNARVYMKTPVAKGYEYTGDIVLFDINDFHFKMHSNKVINSTIHHFMLETETRKKKKIKLKRAHCEGQMIKQVLSDDSDYKYTYIVSYKPLTELNRHMVDRYFLKKSMA